LRKYSAIFWVPAYVPEGLGIWIFFEWVHKKFEFSLRDQKHLVLELKYDESGQAKARFYALTGNTSDCSDTSHIAQLCRRACLGDNQCQAYSYNCNDPNIVPKEAVSSCRIWISDLSNLQEEYTGGRNLFVRVAKSVIGTPFTLWNILGFI
jgi:hypothetical protein